MVSIIIPIYKSEKYLRRCLDSILCQTYKEYEIILIIDGSPDNSIDICKEYSAKYQNIRYYEKENGGVSSARNMGLKYAKGNYVTFIDSDDFVSETYLSHLFSKETDLSVCGFIDMPSKRENIISRSNQIFSYKNINSLLSIHINSMHFKSVWAKLFKTEIIKQYNLSFDTNIYFGEDSTFMLQYLQHCNSILILGGYDYFYFIPSPGKYILKHKDFRYAVKKKVNEYGKLKSIFRLSNDLYIEKELHDMISRLFIYELNHKYKASGYNRFKNTFIGLHELSHINTNDGGKLFKFIIKRILSNHYLTAFLTLRFIYPLTLIGTNRYI
jgi:glycosyltransferase involved in cell wall biosynthesis